MGGPQGASRGFKGLQGVGLWRSGWHVSNRCVTVAWLLPILAAGGEPEQMIEARASGDPFEALGDPNRRHILRLLSDGDKPVQEIAAALPISRPAVSRHLLDRKSVV